MDTGAGGAQAFGDSLGQSGIAKLANENPDLAIDLAFEVGLAARAQEATAEQEPNDAVSEEEIAAFVAAVRYLEQDPSQIDKEVFDPESSDSAFLTTLAGELEALNRSASGVPGAESMGLAGDAIAWLSKGLRAFVDPVANAGSDALLRLIRRPLSEKVALFLGYIIVYLRWHESQTTAGTAHRIFKPIADDLVQACKKRTADDPLIVVAHSLGAVVLYDLFSDGKQMAAIEQAVGHEFSVDSWVAVGAQPGLFADMGLYPNPPAMTVNGKLPRPPAMQKCLNVYDCTDVLSSRCELFFEGVEDFEFDNVASLFSAHSAYFQRPSFYSRLRTRLSP